MKTRNSGRVYFKKRYIVSFGCIIALGIVCVVWLFLREQGYKTQMANDTGRSHQDDFERREDGTTSKEASSSSNPNPLVREGDLKEKGWIVEEGRTVDREMLLIARGLQLYQERYGRLPKGNNREIAAVLTSAEDEKPIIYWSKYHRNDNGEFLDPWGTPYYLVVDGDKYDIRSAGENRKFGDADDEMLK